jgi:hypothetical protein
MSSLPPASPRPPRSRRRSRILTLAIIAVAIFVVILLVLIGLGVLVLPGPSKPTVTITHIQWTIQQGTTNGHGWFGNNSINQTEQDGVLPVSVASGGRFTVSIILLATSNHTMYSASANNSFVVSGCDPILPTTPMGVDDFKLTVSLVAPSVSGDTTTVLGLTLNALNSAVTGCAG